MNPNYIPGVLDASKHIEDSVTKTASYNGASLDLGPGYAPGGMGEALVAVVNVTALDLASGNETYIFTLQESADNATFTTCGPPIPATGVGAIAVPGFVTFEFVRVVATLAGTTPSITYTTDFTVDLG